MNIISIAVIAFVVPAILNRLSVKAAESSSGTTDHFTMRPMKEISSIGWAGAGFFLFCIIGSSLAGQFDGFLAVVFGGLFLLGVLLILLPVKGFWEVRVDGDIMVSVRLWIIRKTISIKDIDHCILHKGGYQIFLKGQRMRALSIDGLSSNTEIFEERMKQEGIEIRAEI